MYKSESSPPQKKLDFENSFTNYLDYIIGKEINEYVLSEYYLEVGKPDSKQGWIIYISIWKSHFPKIIEPLLSYLLNNNHSFKIPIDTDIHNMINDSNLGYSNQGKIIIIMPKSGTDLSKLLSDLTDFTTNMKGTNVPTAINIGHLIYTKYGSYENTEPKSIIDPMGNKILDLDVIPPRLFTWLKWPFTQIVLPKPTINQRIIHGKYYIKDILKNDKKGFVYKVLYQKNLFSYKTCILKEGKMGMLEDDHGRDIEDRLQWQFQLHKQLSDYIPIPKAIDLFKENSNSFFSLEFINGSSLGTYLGDKFNGNQWFNLKVKEKITIVNILIRITEIINSLHEKKYVHRDINPENFIVAKNGTIWLIDLELAYDLKHKIPIPPFEKGTEGYMSPEQFSKQEPTFEQDYYSIGSLILMAITQFNPFRLNKENKELLKDNLSFFINDEKIVNLIISCYNDNPTNRPSLEEISNSLLKFKDSITEETNLHFKERFNINYHNLEQLIINAISTIANPIMSNLDDLWISPVSPKDSVIGNIRTAQTVYPGFRKGIGGILLFLSEAQLEGFNIESCNKILSANWAFLKHIIENPNNDLELGLYHGLSGIALSMNSLIKSSLIPNDAENIKIINNCFYKLPATLDISSGIAGFGLALIKCSSRLPEEFFARQLKNCIEIILQYQLPNGSWKIDTVHDKPVIKTGFDDGIAGIIYFLLTYIELFDNYLVKAKTILALNYLKTSAIKDGNNLLWPIIVGRREVFQFSNGNYQLLRPFIKAYKITNDISYKIITEKVLKSYPEFISSDWLSQEGGLAGLGELYLDAWLAFENDEWFKRAGWITNILMHYIYGTGNNTFWIQEIPHLPNASLLIGNSGIIRYLIRFFTRSTNLHFILDL